MVVEGRELKGWEIAKTHLSQLEEGKGTGVLSIPFRNLTADAQEELDKKHVEDRAAQGKPRVQANPYVSDVDSCARKRFFKFKDVTPTNPPSPETKTTWAMGHAWEDIQAEKWKAAGVRFAQEVPAEMQYHGHRVSGRIDYAMRLTEDQLNEWGFAPVLEQLGLPPDGDFPVELKTKNLMSMKFQIGKEKAGGDGNRQQLNIYLHLSQLGLVEYELDGVVYKPKWDWGALLYGVVGATGGTPIEHGYVVIYDPIQAEKDLKDLVTVANMAKRDIDPGIPFAYMNEKKQKGRLPNFPCANYCEFRDHCWK